MTTLRPSLLAPLLAAIIVLFAGFAPLNAQVSIGDAHLAIENPAELSKEDANRIYNGLMAQMADGYGMSRLEIIADYQSWKRYNTAPYLSATHGRRFVNNYANTTGETYGSLAEGESHPPGTVLAKDSITVTADGKTYPAAMFVMEKLAAGLSPKTADWRYLVVNPDGSLFGDTMGEEPELVKYCHACHEAMDSLDYVFFVPEDYLVAE